MKNWIASLISVVIFCIGPVVLAADENKITVSVSHSGEDIVGQKLVFSLREAIRGSNGYQLISGPSALIRVSLVTLDPDKTTSGSWTVASVVITMRNFNQFNNSEPQTWYPIYLTSSVVTSGTYKVDETAKGILASIDAAIENYRSDARSQQ